MDSSRAAMQGNSQQRNPTPNVTLPAPQLATPNTMSAGSFGQPPPHPSGDMFANVRHTEMAPPPKPSRARASDNRGSFGNTQGRQPTILQSIEPQEVMQSIEPQEIMQSIESDGGYYAPRGRGGPSGGMSRGSDRGHNAPRGRGAPNGGMSRGSDRGHNAPRGRGAPSGGMSRGSDRGHNAPRGRGAPSGGMSRGSDRGHNAPRGRGAPSGGMSRGPNRGHNTSRGRGNVSQAQGRQSHTRQGIDPPQMASRSGADTTARPNTMGNNARGATVIPSPFNGSGVQPNGAGPSLIRNSFAPPSHLGSSARTPRVQAPNGPSKPKESNQTPNHPRKPSGRPRDDPLQPLQTMNHDLGADTGRTPNLNNPDGFVPFTTEREYFNSKMEELYDARNAALSQPDFPKDDEGKVALVQAIVDAMRSTSTAQDGENAQAIHAFENDVYTARQLYDAAWQLLYAMGASQGRLNILRRKCPATVRRKEYDSFSDRFNDTLRSLRTSKAACKQALAEHALHILAANAPKVVKNKAANKVLNIRRNEEVKAGKEVLKSAPKIVQGNQVITLGPNGQEIPGLRRAAKPAEIEQSESPAPTELTVTNVFGRNVTTMKTSPMKRKQPSRPAGKKQIDSDDPEVEEEEEEEEPESPPKSAKRRRLTRRGAYATP